MAPGLLVAHTVLRHRSICSSAAPWLAGGNFERTPAFPWCEGAEAQSPSMDDGLKIARMMRWPAFFFLLTTYDSSAIMKRSLEIQVSQEGSLW